MTGNRLTIGERIRNLLQQKPMSESNLVEEIIFQFCGDWDAATFNPAMRKHGNVVRQEIRRQLEKGNIEHGYQLKLELAEK